MKKLFGFIIGTVVVLAAICAGMAWYVKPAEALDLNYKEVEITGKIIDMIRTRKLEAELTEQDINDIVKKQLAAHSTLPNDIQIEGAKLTLRGTDLEADVNIRWRDQIPVGAKMWFNLAWDSQNINIQHIGTRINDVQIPSDWVQLAPISIPLEEYLPKLVGVKDVHFEEKAIRIQLNLLR
ncbi:hypothetical protein [Paenibacillus sp. SI8]|uniref:hypothetical protein n=1 Tax=unclassified Paenibacillus TaxID=185978 RepID=UPI0034665B5A